MKPFSHPVTFGLLAFTLTAIESCQTQSAETLSPYEINISASDSKLPKEISSWYILGQIADNFVETHQDSFLTKPFDFYTFLNPDTLNPLWYNGIYTPRYNQLDLKEVFGVTSSDSLFGKYVYLACNLHSEQDIDLFLNVKSGLECEHFLDGQWLTRRDIQGENFYPIHLRKGENHYVARTKAIGQDTWFEAQVMDSINMASMFANGQSNNILFPEIASATKIGTLTNAHQNLLATDVSLNITDVNGQTIHQFLLVKDTFSYHLPELLENHAYLCTMEIAGQTVRQPIVCGSYDTMFAYFQRRRQHLGDDNPRSAEIDQLLYRTEFLLNHETRHHDWWWQFKLPPLLYQLEHTFAHLDKVIGQDKNDFNVQFVTYKSTLDNGRQRYLLVTPDSVHNGRKYPLVVIVRPHVMNHHHFFTSPQFAHQWAINIVQSLANSHGFIVMMPEARTYLNEDVTPLAEAEFKQALNDVKSHFNVDNERIYLHGICSGGYRALKLAALNPELFAAIGLYTPTYHQPTQNTWESARSLEKLLPNLAGTPIMIFADPNDRHTAFDVYSDLIDDCHTYGIPLTFTQKINTELLYNAVVAGREAFEFFDGKRKEGKTLANAPIQEIAIADLYAQPYSYVYCHDNRSALYRSIVLAMQHEYEDYLDCSMPLLSDDEVDETTIANRNLFLIGDHFCNPHLQQLVASTGNNISDDLSQVSIHYNPNNWKRKFVLYRISAKDKRIMRFPWIIGTRQTFTFDEPQ